MTKPPTRAARGSSIALMAAVACVVTGLVMIAGHDASNPAVAIVVTTFGALLALGLALIFERRQARRAAERAVELEQLSAELIRANRTKSEFLANVSHELRTPLNAIVGFAELLREGAYGTLNARQAGPVERIESSAAYLRRMVDQILDLARIAAGRVELGFESVDLRALAIDVATEMESLITERAINLSLSVSATLPRIQTDPSHLRQILTNLLGNAIKFTAPGGSITIRARQAPGPDNANREPGRFPESAGWVALQVVDSGRGIAAADLDRIFDEFVQASARGQTADTPHGTGLGLSISRRLARLLGGDITVESELDRGSIFSIWLPVDRPHSPVTSPPDRPTTF
jgi:two-component system NtrC family sensor kinase